nr:MAG TPA: hypothetical protein [Caudoviricetes sp.]
MHKMDKISAARGCGGGRSGDRASPEQPEGRQTGNLTAEHTGNACVRFLKHTRALYHIKYARTRVFIGLLKAYV